MDLHVSLVGRRDLTGEIYRQLRRGILDGRLRPGEKLPPSRELAQRLSVARTTVTVAYDRLTGEGFVTSKVGAGTFVSDWTTSTGHATRRTRRADSSLRPRPIWDAIPVPSVFDRPADFEFRTGVPDARLFPYETWRRLVAHELRGHAVGAGLYADPAGHAGLRGAIVRHLGRSRAVLATADDVTVTNGTQQAVDIIGRVLLSPGDRVAIEDPGYPPPRHLFESLGARVAGVPVDDEGLVVEAIPRGTRLVYVTPSHQFPLGLSMSLARRMALLAWVERHNAAVVEDDYDSEFRFGGRPIEPLQTLDTGGRVIYVGSFSKTTLATLRLGFLVTPPALRRAVRVAKYVTDWHTTLPIQGAMARFIDQGWLARHTRKMRSTYQRRHQQVVATITERFADRLEVVPSTAGLHVCALAPSLPVGTIAACVRRASAAGVEALPLSMFAVDEPPRAGLVLGYGAIPTERIEEGLFRLRAAFDEVMADAPS
ncbi:MAG: PLP-dependent aminotransferase family protein [Acidimicrobiales bacterium]